MSEQGGLFGGTEPIWLVTHDRPGGRMRIGMRAGEVVTQILRPDGAPAGGLLVCTPVQARCWAAALAMAAAQAERSRP